MVEATSSLEELWRLLVDFTRSHHLLVSSILGIGFGYILIRQWMIGGPVRSQARMHGKTVLITGGNSGLGKAAAEELLKRGARVIIACRDVKKGAAALKEMHTATGQNRGSAKLLDLSSFKSIHAFVDSFIKEEKKLDVLINNAGVICPRWVSEDGFELQFAVNYLGHFLLTNLLMDLLKKSAPSRIINVTTKGYETSVALCKLCSKFEQSLKSTTEAGNQCTDIVSYKCTMAEINFDDLTSTRSYSAIGTYHNTKLYNILFTRELSRRLRGTDVTANCLHPGLAYTNISRHVLKFDWNWVTQLLVITLGQPLYYLFSNSPQQSVRTIVYCAVAPELDNISGKFFCDSRIAELLPHAMDTEAAERLWDSL